MTDVYSSGNYLFPVLYALISVFLIPIYIGAYVFISASALTCLVLIK